MRRKESALQMCKNKTKANVFSGYDCCFLFQKKATKFELVFVVEYLKQQQTFKERKWECNFFDMVLSLKILIYQC